MVTGKTDDYGFGYIIEEVELKKDEI